MTPDLQVPLSSPRGEVIIDPIQTLTTADFYGRLFEVLHNKTATQIAMKYSLKKIEETASRWVKRTLRTSSLSPEEVEAAKFDKYIRPILKREILVGIQVMKGYRKLYEDPLQVKHGSIQHSAFTVDFFASTETCSIYPMAVRALDGIGMGTFKRVFRAVDYLSGRECALSQPTDRFLESIRSCKRFAEISKSLYERNKTEHAGIEKDVDFKLGLLRDQALALIDSDKEDIMEDVQEIRAAQKELKDKLAFTKKQCRTARRAHRSDLKELSYVAQAYVREFQVSEALSDHENIATGLACHHSRAKDLLVQELYDGDLAHLIKTQEFSYRQKVQIARGMIAAFAALHELFTHGDPKLENFLFKREDDTIIPALCDYGSSRPIGETGKYGGTLHNMPPELAKMECGDVEHPVAADIWALGISLWELLHQGEHPIEDLREQGLGHFEIVLILSNLDENPISDSKLRFPVDSLIRQMLELDPLQRIKPGESLEVIDHILADLED